MLDINNKMDILLKQNEPKKMDILQLRELLDKQSATSKNSKASESSNKQFNISKSNFTPKWEKVNKIYLERQRSESREKSRDREKHMDCIEKIVEFKDNKEEQIREINKKHNNF